MSDNRDDRPRAMGQLTADDPFRAGPTIVGGQPPPKNHVTLAGVPVGIERVLYLAAVEPDFKEALLGTDDRQQVVADRGLEMKPSELAMLRMVPASQLRANIDGVDTSDDNVERRTFLRTVAAGAMAISAAEAFTGCGSANDGVRPDTRPWGPDSTGVRPDMPSGLDTATGSRPDMPGATKDGEAPDQGKVDVKVSPGYDSAGVRPGDGSS